MLFEHGFQGGSGGKPLFLTVGACENGLVFHRLWHEHGYFFCALVSSVSDLGLYVPVCFVVLQVHAIDAMATQNGRGCGVPLSHAHFSPQPACPAQRTGSPGRGKYPNI